MNVGGGRFRQAGIFLTTVLPMSRPASQFCKGNKSGFHPSRSTLLGFIMVIIFPGTNGLVEGVGDVRAADSARGSGGVGGVEDSCSAVMLGE